MVIPMLANQDLKAMLIATSFIKMTTMPFFLDLWKYHIFLHFHFKSIFVHHMQYKLFSLKESKIRKFCTLPRSHDI